MIAKVPEGMSPEECPIDLSSYLLQDPKALGLAIGAVTAHSGKYQALIRDVLQDYVAKAPKKKSNKFG